MSDPFDNWRRALTGEKLMVYEDEPWCGYFRQRDRRGLNLHMAPIKRPWIACAIWLDASGKLVAERAKEPVPVEWIWPHCVKDPIPYETYLFWHQNERWPEEAKVA